MANHSTHEKSTWHPMAMVAFVTLMAGGCFSALWLYTLAQLPEGKPLNITYGLLALALLTITVAVYTRLTRSLHHSPMLPDHSEREIRHYRELFPH
ncbi:MAG: hypothetical protein QM809_08505 [Gordonia sp. (in: high G+C Gram-positive bacteria)]|uniref:hypothetical protein n=1 Tax=Gordonia sp. (in: high G+C Gram-positive bacteria) TaxID=84139 RepID=UPI0039E5F73E